jgi:hypothetical protein
MDIKLSINKLDLSNAVITRDKEIYAESKDKKNQLKNQINIAIKAFLKIFIALTFSVKFKIFNNYLFRSSVPKIKI